jgi:Holliday junction resolvase RusA-like endonuclease
MMRDPVSITLPWIPNKTVCGNTRTPDRYRTPEKRRLRENGFNDGLTALVTWRFVPMVQITYKFYTVRKQDIDNLSYGMKSYQDGIVAAEVVEDDDPTQVVPGPHRWAKAKRGEEHTVVTFEEVTD